MASQYDDPTDPFARFMNHSTSERGAYLRNWKGEQGYIDTWMHTRAMPRPVWRHQLVKLFVREDKATREPTTHVYSENYICPESDDVLKRQYRRGEDGSRDMPPESCGICKLIDWCVMQVAARKLHPADVLLKFEADDPREAKVYHVAGIYNGFAKMESPEQKADLKRRGVFLNDVWKENANAKSSYVFAIVDHEAPEAGMQVTTVTGLLGDKVRDVIRDRIESMGDEGDPRRRPYAIRWQYRDKEKEFSKKYHALAMDKLVLTDEVRALIEGPAPDLSRSTTPFSNATLLPILQRACQIPNVPWDELFAARARGGSPRAAAAPPPPAAPRAEPVVVAPAPAAAAEPAPVLDADGMELFACDGCNKPVRENWNRCPACNMRFEGDGLIDPPAPAAPAAAQRRRRIANPAPAAAPPAAPRAAPRATPPVTPPFLDADSDGREEDEDQIPF